MSKNKKDVSIIRSSAAEYLTFVAATGDSENSVIRKYRITSHLRTEVPKNE